MDFSLLRKKSFFLLSFGSFVSLMGTLIQQFALSLYVLNTTGSGVMFATVIAVGTIPRLVLGPFGGVLADKLDRKKTFVSLDILSGCLTLIFAVLFYIKGYLSVGEIIIYVVLIQVINAFFEPAIATVVPSILEKEQLMGGNAFLSTMRQVANVLSPLVAGVLYGQFGLTAVMLVNGISFLCSGFSEMFIEMPKMELTQDKMSIKYVMDEFQVGLNYVKKSKLVIGILFLGTFVNFAFGGMFSVLLPYMFLQKFGVSETQYGLFSSVICIGMVVGPGVGLLWDRFSTTENIISRAMSLTSLMMVGLAFYTSAFVPQYYQTPIPLMIGTGVFMFVASVLISIINVCIATHIQKTVPLEILGRVGSVISTLIMASMPIGQMVFGAMLEVIDPSTAFLVTALFGFVGVGGFIKLTREPGQGMSKNAA
ncbi:MFS transporter [Fusibacter sp. JL216-2]|uniref:MFS transporter n=1 Tax=Fusibacter sp. JL216-2 TaxID=3071453 RepID=UPI003D347600